MFDSISIDGVDIHYQAAGEGPAVLFLHGFSGNHLSWWRQVPAFDGEYRTIVPDQRGFGRSRDRPDGPGVAAFVDDLLALLDHLDNDRVAVVGHSMSGWPAASLATQHPDRVAALVLSGTPGGLIDRERHEQFVAAADETLDEPPVSEEHAFLSEAITELNTDAPDEFADVRSTLEGLPIDAGRIVDAGVPTLLVAGEADPFMPGAALSAVRDRLDGAEQVTIGGAAHSANFERPEQFNRHVRGFVDEHAEF